MRGNKPLKCYFAFGHDIENNQCYIDMLMATLSSARKNTTLDLYCLYDGTKDDKLYSLMKEYGVNIKIASIPFFDKIKKIYTNEYMFKVLGYTISDNSLKSRFLRMLISEYEKEDDYILYCDTDILFLKDIKLSDFPKLPEFIGVCPEFYKVDDYTYFNAGIMLINMKRAKEKYDEFLDIISDGKRTTIECCDQGYLNDIYKGQFDRLPFEYNWKPYWGKNVNAKIVHFHGVKPNTESVSKKLFLSNALMEEEGVCEAYYYYYDLFCKYSGVDKDIVFEKVTRTLLANFPMWEFVKGFKKFDKRYKKLKLVIRLLAVFYLLLLLKLLFI